MRIDLHTHSNASDGTDDPSDLPHLAREAGLHVIGLTDHDTVAGWSRAQAQVCTAGVALVRGMEMTAYMPADPARHPLGKTRISVHMLAYLFDPHHPLMCAHIDHMVRVRSERAREIVDRLAKDYPIRWSDVQAKVKGNAPIGRPHIADALVELGIVPDRTSAFRSILRSSSPYYVPSSSPLAMEVVEWVNAAGGKAVLAHPKARARANFLCDRDIEKITEAGLFGIEIAHRDNPVELRGQLADLAERLQLRQFGSSDYHGTGKPNALGENTSDSQVYHDLLKGVFLPVIKP